MITSIFKRKKRLRESKQTCEVIGTWSKSCACCIVHNLRLPSLLVRIQNMCPHGHRQVKHGVCQVTTTLNVSCIRHAGNFHSKLESGVRPSVVIGGNPPLKRDASFVAQLISLRNLDRPPSRTMLKGFDSPRNQRAR